jgi:hypothetical protein
MLYSRQQPIVTGVRIDLVFFSVLSPVVAFIFELFPQFFRVQKIVALPIRTIESFDAAAVEECVEARYLSVEIRLSDSWQPQNVQAKMFAAFLFDLLDRKLSRHFLSPL